MSNVNVLIVDDSATMRAFVRNALSGDEGVTVIGEARDAADARQKIKELNPDVVTLDVEMPGMDGLEFLEKIMRLRPLPVIMVSTLTAPGAATAVAALEYGAFDCIEKPNGRNRSSLEALPNLVRQAAAAGRQIAQRGPRAASSAGRAEPALTRKAGWPDVVAIGASTGGVEALIAVLSDFPEDCPPTVIVQHMPETFTASFANRLNRASKATVTEAVDGEPLKRGHVYLARGGRHLVVRSGALTRCVYRDSDAVQGHRPSVDVLFQSVSKEFGKSASAVLMTGMGRDGAEGLLAIREVGGRTFAQDEATSLVYGMPRAARDIGAVSKGTPLHKITKEIFS
ncbi:chemotaxis response regulator protein-glutamate methylesterase [Fulvimarina sp. 2208YS6-2-32]|uniref:Protein-glutamate methylesterase/protein-glutamine glutaminase n=1 Tax=Fulvimarina uroteuthidis TaxID=3098149 RepID=A0ABU5HYC7_9HYPH|nr:chemotaxis response regulator protein-glutamate methylesterase [Fulvimarina sp. 2208YS6-2-32]MDY8107778.1 chemotaxis response regulator protein-glutamate methylesterase [Fulvimarina sp. 2208YS6-2-32]